MGALPQLVKGDVMQLPPLITAGYGADFNGDSCRTHLFFALVGDILYAGPFEEFVKLYVLPEYSEEKAVEMFGCQTSIFKFEDARIVKVPSIDSEGRVGWHTANAISIHTSHGEDCYEVKTTCGLSAIFTAHHNFLALNDDCNLVPVKTEQVHVGDLLPTIFGIDTEIKDIHVPYKDLELTFDSGVWLGHYLADGAITGRGDTVSHASNDKTLLEWLEDRSTTFSNKRPWYEGNQLSLRITDKELVKTLDSWVGRGCAGKQLAGWMYSAPREFRLGLIVGYLLGEGNNGGHGIRVECVNRGLLLGFKAILSSLGVPSSVRYGKKPTVKTKETWVLRINTVKLQSLKLAWPACTKSKQFMLMETTKTREVWDKIPLPPTVVDICKSIGKKLAGGAGRKLREKLNRGTPVPEYKQFVTSAARGYCTRAYALKLIAGYGLDNLDNAVIKNWISLINNRNLVWEQIESITKVERPAVTYDMTVPDGETFCIDGFYLTHNTMNYHVPATEEAKKEVLAKLLPSKNLLSVADFGAHYLPRHEYQGGLYHASTARDEKRRPVVFRNKSDALKAYREGRIALDTPVEIVQN
jgi:intein/homing endonuclease